MGGKMQYRKLIKFGDSSFVISLPKDWVEKNSLKKGDVIGVETGSKNELYILPKSTPERELKEITINLDEIGKGAGIKTYIISAYVKNYDIINIIGTDLVKNSQFIRNCVNQLASAEIVEQNSKKITARCFLDPHNLSVQALIRRLDVMTRSMLQDAKTSISSDNLLEYAYQKEDDVTRISFLLLRILRKSLDEPEVANILKVTPVEVIESWQLISQLEDVADQAKRICRHLQTAKVKNKAELENVFTKVIEHYETAMKSYYTKNPEMAGKVIHEKKEVMDLCYNPLAGNEMDHSLISIVEKMRRIVASSLYIGKITLDR